MRDIEQARQNARGQADRKIAEFYARFADDIRRWNLRRNEQRFLKCITSEPITGGALMSNAGIRRVGQYAMIDACLREYELDPDRQPYFIILAWDAGGSWERAPDIDYV